MSRIDSQLRRRFTAAAHDLGGSDAARRRVLDPAPGRSLRPLSAAFALAVVIAAGGAAAARLSHPATPGGAVQHGAGTPTPSGSKPSPSPTPAPQSLTFAPFFAHDDLTIGAPAAYGHLSLTGTDNTLAVGSYHLAGTTDPASPATAPVWRLDRSPSPDAASLGARFGDTGSPTAGVDGYLSWRHAGYEPNHNWLSYSSGTMPNPATLAHLDAVPTDVVSAGTLATRFMQRRGLLLDGALKPRVFPVDPGHQPNIETFSVTWGRTVSGYLMYGDTGSPSMSIGQDGAVINVTESSVRVAGGSAYPLVPWRQAWTQVAAGRWYAERGGFTGGNGQSRLDRFDAITVELGYLDGVSPATPGGATERTYLVPMWVFSTADGLRLFYPAVASSGLSYTWAPKPFPSPH